MSVCMRMMGIITAAAIIMYSYNYSPSAASLRLTKSTSAQKFYRQATERTQHHESHVQNSKGDCLACRHEQQMPSRVQPISSPRPSRLLPPPTAQQEYYAQTGTLQMDNLRKSIRFLEGLIERNKAEHIAALARSELRVAELTQSLEQKSSLVIELQRKVVANQILQQYASASVVGTYLDKDDAEEVTRLNARVRELSKAIQQLQVENQSLKTIPAGHVDRGEATAVQILQQRVRECEVYAREYEAMKLLIHKMEVEKEQTQKKQQKGLNELIRRHKDELKSLEEMVEEVRNELEERDRLLQGKEREIERTRLATEDAAHSQLERLQELIEERDQQLDKLESKLNCVEAELTFLKNRFGYLLKLTKTVQSSRNMEPTSTSVLEDYCIQRVGRHNISNNGKQSLMGLNLSPIRRR